MRSLLVLLLSISMNMLLAQVDPSWDFEELVCKEAEGHRGFFDQMLQSSPLTEQYDLKYYRFDWYVDPAQYNIQGSATPYFETRVHGFSEIHFDFSSELSVDSVEYHGQSLSFEQPEDFLLTIHLPAPLDSGTIDSLTITYSGAPPTSGLGSFVQSTHNGFPVLWTLSDPYGSQDWWPCKNGLGDKIDSIDVYLTTPAMYLAASNGALVSESLDSIRYTCHWKHRYPITPYLVAIAVTNYTAYRDTVNLNNGRSLTMLNYVYPESIGSAQTGTKNLTQVLAFYDSLFVDYPFETEKYGHAQFGWGGGMEHQTMSFVTGYTWGLLAHELAHQWFGDMVTVGSFEDIWLSEGFATYLEGLTQERFRGASAWMSWKSSKLNNIVSQTNGTVLVPDTTDVNRIFNGRLTYNKGAFLAHMLRWKLGDTVFFEGLRNFLDQYAYRYARTPDLQKALEAASGEDLSEFFQDWYRGQGYPQYTLYWDQQDGYLIIQLEQLQSNASVDFFEMPVPVRVSGAGQDTMLRLDHTYSGQIFSIPIGFEISEIAIDPEIWLISKSNKVIRTSLTATHELANGVHAVCMPNPASDQLRVQLVGKTSGKSYAWRLQNLFGQEIGSGTLAQESLKLDISGLPSAIYALILHDDLGGAQTILFARQ